MKENGQQTSQGPGIRPARDSPGRRSYSEDQSSSSSIRAGERS